MKYTAPTQEQLRKLKDQLGLTGDQMAQVFGLASGVQWRKYSCGSQHLRDLPLQRAFYMAALQVLTNDEIERVRVYMASFGAKWERDGDEAAHE